MKRAAFIPFTATTRMSGIDWQGQHIRKGASDAVLAWVREQHGSIPSELDTLVKRVSMAGGTPLVVARDAGILGVIYLKDIVKGGIRERFDQLRSMGIRTVMITGDNPLTAAFIAKEAGVDDFLAEATPETKLELIRNEQRQGKLVAMAGDGTNDAPALAQADVGGRDEHRHHGGEGSRKHGGFGLKSYKTNRDRGNRQAVADDARLADHLQHRQ